MKQQLNVHYRGIGTFTCKQYKERTLGFNKSYVIPEKYVVKLKFDRSMKELVEASRNETPVDLSDFFIKETDAEKT